jgi:hypothetical protein
MRSLSTFPFVIDFTYCAALVSASTLGVARCFTFINMQALDKMTSSRTFIMRAFLIVVCLACLYFGIFSEIADAGGSRREGIMLRASQSRIGSIFVIDGLFVVYYSSIFLVMFEISNLIRWSGDFARVRQ